MNFENYNLDNLVILTTRSTTTSIVKVKFNYDSINVEASKSCFRSVESELNCQCLILEALGFSDKQIKELSYE